MSELDTGTAPTPEPARVPFRDGKGGDLPVEWAAYMLAYWYESSSKGKRPSFGDVLQLTVAHFMMGKP